MDDKETPVEVTDKEIELTRDILRTITKTLKTFTVYPKDNPIYQKFADDLFQKFNAIFEFQTGDELTFDVERNGLLYKEKKVFQNEDKTDNIALLLYADGIRQVSFHKGITFEEIVDFINVLRIAPKTESLDDDILTLLWEKDIKNLSYTVVEEAVDDTLLVEDMAQAESAQEDGATTLYGASYSSEMTIKPISLRLKLEPLVSDELEALKAEILAGDEESLLSSAVGLFFELLASDTDEAGFEEIIKNTGKILDIRLAKNDLKTSYKILSRLKEVSESVSAPGRKQLIEGIFSVAGSIENIRRLFKGSFTQEEIKQYLLLFGKAVVPHIIEILGEFEDRRKRRFMCDILTGIGRNNIDALLWALKDERWYLVRNIVLVLGFIKNPATIKQIGNVLRNPEPRVRREVIKALDGFSQAEDAKKFLLIATKDGDQAVRVGAFKALRKFKSLNLFQIMKEGVSRDEIKKKSFTEKKEFLETLAVVGGEEAFLLLSGLFKKKGFIVERDEVTELRAAAAYALGVLGSPDALSLVEKETRSRRSFLREACLKVIQEAGRSGGD